jgi:hypothetical protein
LLIDVPPAEEDSATATGRSDGSNETVGKRK